MKTAALLMVAMMAAGCITKVEDVYVESDAGVPLACHDGYTSCGPQPADGGFEGAEYAPICADLMIDSNNCGACNNVCVTGGGCLDGKCLK